MKLAVKKKEKEVFEPHIFDFSESRGTWGHHIELTGQDQEKGTVKGNGHIGGFLGSSRVRVGDLLLVKGQKGWLMTFRFTKVEYQRDPNDHFFFTAQFVKEVAPDGQ